MTDDRNRDPVHEDVDNIFGVTRDEDDGANDPPIRAVPRRAPAYEGDEDDDDIDEQTPDGRLSSELEDGTDAPVEAALFRALGKQKKRARGKTAPPAKGEARARAPGRERGKPKTGALPALRREMQPDTPALRAERVEAIRRDLVRRRRRKGGNLLLRLAAFVLVPTLVVAWFLWERATPFYVSNSVFRVLSADNPSGQGGGLFSGMFGGGAGNSQDAVAVEKFILSRDVLRRLEAEHGFISHYKNSDLDYFHRLKSDTTFEDAFDLYAKMVNVSFDPTEGVLQMAVRASTPEDAQRFGKAIIDYSEEMVDQLSNRLRQDALSNAAAKRQEAEDRAKAARESVAAMRNQQEVFSVPVEVERKLSIVTQLELQLVDRQNSLANRQRFAPASDSRIQALQVEIETLQTRIGEMKREITNASDNSGSLAQQNIALEGALAEKEIADAIMAAAIQAEQQAEAEANRQHRYLAIVDSPSMPDKSAYPKKLQTVALFFLIFLGGYILLTLTISLIREQASI
ncbi:MAG: hypothetical protein AAFR17_00750 [Pseudomonadota bacterium]